MWYLFFFQEEKETEKHVSKWNKQRLMQTTKHLPQYLIYPSPLPHCVPVTCFLCVPSAMQGAPRGRADVFFILESDCIRCSAWYTVGTNYMSVRCMTKPMNTETHRQSSSASFTMRKNSRVNWSVQRTNKKPVDLEARAKVKAYY